MLHVGQPQNYAMGVFFFGFFLRHQLYHCKSTFTFGEVFPPQTKCCLEQFCCWCVCKKKKREHFCALCNHDDALTIYIFFFNYIVLFALPVTSDTFTLELCTGRRYPVIYCAHCPVLIFTVLSSGVCTCTLYRMCRSYLVRCLMWSVSCFM